MKNISHASSSDLAEIGKLIDSGKVKTVVETVLPCRKPGVLMN